MAKKKEKLNYAEMPKEELARCLTEAREKLFHLRFRGGSAPLKNPMEIRSTRREVARLMTFLAQKGERP